MRLKAPFVCGKITNPCPDVKIFFEIFRTRLSQKIENFKKVKIELYAYGFTFSTLTFQIYFLIVSPRCLCYAGFAAQPAFLTPRHCSGFQFQNPNRGDREEASKCVKRNE